MTSKEKTKILATPGKPMSQDEFFSIIEDAEKGTFTPLDDSKKRFEEWKLQRKK